jgi:hypothetical protein
MRTRSVTSALLALLIVSPALGLAADICVEPNRFAATLRTGSRPFQETRVLVLDPAVTKGAGTDVEDISATVDVSWTKTSGAPETGGFVIPAGSGLNGWRENTPDRATFSNRSRRAPKVDTSAAVAVIRPGRSVRLRAEGLGDGGDLLSFCDPSPPAGNVAVRYCVTNGGEESCHTGTLTDCECKQLRSGPGVKLVCTDGLPCGCGNGVIEPGEICDPCPTDCDDGNACTIDTLVGDPAQCAAECEHAPVTACADGDGCCPAGCDNTSDDDCPVITVTDWGTIAYVFDDQRGRLLPHDTLAGPETAPTEIDDPSIINGQNAHPETFLCAAAVTTDPGAFALSVRLFDSGSIDSWADATGQTLPFCSGGECGSVTSTRFQFRVALPTPVVLTTTIRGGHGTGPSWTAYLLNEDTNTVVWARPWLEGGTFSYSEPVLPAGNYSIGYFLRARPGNGGVTGDVTLDMVLHAAERPAPSLGWDPCLNCATDADCQNAGTCGPTARCGVNGRCADPAFGTSGPNACDTPFYGAGDSFCPEGSVCVDDPVTGFTCTDICMP